MSTKTKASKGEKGGKEKPKKSKLTPKDVAEYFLRLTYFENDTLSNLKIQNLLYYAQGYSLAINNKPLFEDDIVVWSEGPAVASLYDLYEQYGENPIPVNKNLNLNKFSKKEKELLNEVHWVCAQFSAWKLRNLTREERPYRETEIKK